ncbi:putative acetyltransferase [Chitinivorax tropicus]|uniref:Putative acetyltransferase n=1 Tax=Chitinivorax tropicus TaxID=714531 RepID=A0A840MIX5_9PROT|nr:GNAT family N-acetyltransferase [Chitinivorax tropicus]MBB5019154.1 putative acetyltransferase [Chitinivorax tropicus]
MKIDLIRTELSALPIIRNLYQFYAYDSSDWEGSDVEENGQFYLDGDYLRRYWDEPGWSANLIKVNDEIAGFLLIEHDSLPDLPFPEFADLFLLKRFRRMGIGQQIVEGVMLATAHPWIVMSYEADETSQAFWQSIFERLPFHSVRTYLDPIQPDLRIFIINEPQ